MFRFLTAALALAAFPALAQAQAYPSQPIRFIVPFTPGTGIDIIARTLGPRLAERLGQPVVVENRAGASGNIGTELVAKSKPDGHTILVTASTFVSNRSLFRNLPYDPAKDFAPITLSAWGTLLIAAHPSTSFASVPELIAAAKANPGKLNYGSPGVGTPHHLAMELFKNVAGVDIVHVPYKGTAGAVTDLLGGQINLMFLPIHVALPQVRAGKMKAIAVGSPQRSPLAPELPTLAEGGFPGVESDIWYAFFAPQGTPREIIARLAFELTSVLALAEIKASFRTQGLEPVASTPEAVRALVDKDLAKWERVVREAKISPE
ncbi:MAG: Twin-arginine translocation pathway signal [Betaproteobacteria bacterium RIFCSPLOWO2_02_67_12]|nr:MAG: Twin-arginine translocation pathway signal [Betaproteobacteria bacterium RIFCSPLOWO2_02_67_12]OGA31322.1 MAG: Twin-arginine translocation pathway signal [Betaproteobacteria bacterium RIFCSPLOWO2_02_FULL_68_150]OGA70151.1 MAG: Twin-arginine translocation pathway signal [Betaproteobacteria bacterium RIFCSPLOWO2_12_FULL_67_28]